MNPHLSQALAQQLIADMHREAAARRLAAGVGPAHSATGSGTPLRSAGRLMRSRSVIRWHRGRRYRQVELVWPDGVCSVVPAQSDDQPRPFAGSRQ
jgi:hypothetical protein